LIKLNVGNDLYLKGRIGWKGLSKDEYLKKSNYRIINGTALEDKQINWNKCGYISKSRYEESPEIMLQEKDILISKDGTLGKIGYVTNISSPSTVASGIFVMRNITPKKLDSEYLYHFLKSNIFKDFIKRMKSSGSTINHLYQRDLSQLELELPTLLTQQKIANILSTIDAKIELNNKVNKELEDMVKLMYDYWFVQFDFPNKEGKPYKSSGGNMVYNEELKREIPERWNHTTLGNCFDIFDSKRIPLSQNQRLIMEKKYPYYGAAFIVDYVKDYIFDGNYILLGEDGTVIDEYGYPIIQYATGKFWVNNHAHVLKGKNGFDENSLYLMLKNVKIIGAVTGAVQLKINQENLKAILVCKPQFSILKKFNLFIEPMFRKMTTNKNENKQLSKLRDWLLPMLMNGQVSIE